MGETATQEHIRWALMALGLVRNKLTAMGVPESDTAMENLAAAVATLTSIPGMEAAKLPESVAHVHSNGSFCADRQITSKDWPVRLFTEAQVLELLRPAGVALGAAHHHEAWWLIESTVAPRPLYYAGHRKQGDARLTMHMVDDASKAVRFPDEWAAKYALAALLGVKVKEPTWPLETMKFGYAVAEHIFDYTPRGVPACEGGQQ